MSRPATQIPDAPFLALASAEIQAAFAPGPAWEISLARVQDGQAQTPPDWIQLLPAPDANHEIQARDGRKWKLADPRVLLTHFVGHGADLPLDLEHATELKAPKGEPAPAQAWLKQLEVREDRSVWGRPDWTAEGAAAVLARSYRYVSPAMLHDDAGNITGLSSAALVTRPALRMPALARSEGESPTHKDQPMTTIALAAAAAAASLASTASEADVLGAITANARAAADIKDPAKFVPATSLAAALARAETAEGKLADRETADAKAAVDTLVDGGIAEGKIVPASREHFVSIASANPDAFKAALAAMPVILKPSQTDKKIEGGGDGNEHGLSADQVALCSQLGLEQKAYAATLKESN